MSSGPDGTLDVVLRGEVDFTNAPAVMAEVRAAVSQQPPTLVRVQMAQVAFLDSSGIGVLVNVMQAAERVGAGYRVEQPSPKVFDQLRMSGLLEAFGLTEPADPHRPTT